MYDKTERTKIITELHPQHHGSLDQLKTMILQCKTGGADIVKVQLYDSQLLFSDDRKLYASITHSELTSIKAYCDQVGIELLASVFDNERLGWCGELKIPKRKIAFRTTTDKCLCDKIVNERKPTFISTNSDNFLYSTQDYPTIIYMYCVPCYPTFLNQVLLPKSFTKDKYLGYSDHSYGLTAAKTAIVRGAKYIEKHFTLAKGTHYDSEKGHFASLTFQELLDLRQFCDEFAILQ